MQYLVTFFTHSGAVKFKRHLQRLGVEVELMPVPRRLSSDCGLAAKFCTQQLPDDWITPDVQKIFLIKPDGEKLIFSAK